MRLYDNIPHSYIHKTLVNKRYRRDPFHSESMKADCASVKKCIQQLSGDKCHDIYLASCQISELIGKSQLARLRQKRAGNLARSIVPIPKLFNALGVYVETYDFPYLAELHGERKAHIAEAHDPDCFALKRHSLLSRHPHKQMPNPLAIEAS